MTNGFISYYKKAFFKPLSTFKEILKSNEKLLYGFYSILIPAIGYTLFYIMASSAGGAPSTFKPWLAIPIEKYFFYDIFLALPGYFLSAFFKSSIVYLLSRAFKSDVTYDSIFSVIGLTIGIAAWGTMLHDLTDSFLAFIGVINMKSYEIALNTDTYWRYQLLVLFAIYFIWYFVLFTIGIKTATKLNIWKSLFLAFIALASFQSVLLIFIR